MTSLMQLRKSISNLVPNLRRFVVLQSEFPSCIHSKAFIPALHGQIKIGGQSLIRIAQQTKTKPINTQSDEPELQNNRGRGGTNRNDTQQSERPNRDHLQRVHDVLVNSLQHMFGKPMDYRIYNLNIELIDNIRGKRTAGLQAYINQVAFLRMAGHFKFAYVKFMVLNTDISEESARITIRWSIKGISGFQVFIKFWKYRLWDWKGLMDRSGVWYDGISYFDVDNDGLVYRHTIDKVIEDKDRLVDIVKPDKAILAAKLGVLTSLFPESSLSCTHNNTAINKAQICHRANSK